MKTIYLPACGTTDIVPSNPTTEMFNKTKIYFNFFKKDKSVYFYPNFLISAYYGKSVPDLRKNVDDDVFIMGDSGGFQNVTMNANLDPLEILKWQENNCTAGLILDCPPFEKIENSAAFGACSPEVFRNSLLKTCENAKLQLQNRENKKYKMFGVIQGDSDKRRREWYDKISNIEKEHGKFNGWALSPKPSSDLLEIAQHFMLIKEKNISEPLHVLQVTSEEGIALINYFAKYYDKDITFDSSTFTVGRRYGMYNSPYSVKDFYMFGDKDKKTIKNLLCNCPVCDNLDMDDIKKDYQVGEKSIPGILMSLHNQYHMIKYSKFMFGIKDDDELFKKHTQGFSKEFQNAIKYIDMALKIGHEEAYRRIIIGSQGLNAFCGIKEKKLNINPDKYSGIPPVIAIKLIMHEYNIPEQEARKYVNF